MKRRKYKPLTMIALSMIFMIWLILIILVVGTANPSEIVPGIISIIIFPAAISAWAVIARKKIQQEIDLENNSKT